MEDLSILMIQKRQIEWQKELGLFLFQPKDIFVLFHEKSIP